MESKKELGSGRKCGLARFAREGVGRYVNRYIEPKLIPSSWTINLIRYQVFARNITSRQDLYKVNEGRA